MSTIKNSEYLDYIIGKAKQIGERRNPPFTAERFFVAMIDAAQNPEPDQKSAEQAFTSNLLRRIIKDMDAGKAALLEYINKTGEDFLMADLYMKKKIREATELARSSNSETLDVPHLLILIRRDPTEAIRAIMIPDEPAQEEPETKEVPESKEPKESQEVKVEEEEEQSATDFWDLFGDDEEEAEPVTMATLVSDVKKIREGLRNTVFGQDNAIDVFSNGYFQANLLHMIDKKRNKPKATFLFAGPPGVGKTFLAEEVAAALGLPFRRFDMSEYADKESHIEFAGSDKVYKNGKAGNVTSFVADNPQCVLLFDEIEKAHLSVIHLFLQLLDAGRVRDNFTDKEVSFQDAVVIMTTNAGRQLYEDSESGDFSSVPRKVIIKALQQDKNPVTGAAMFPGAICSRLASGNVVMFNHMGAHNLRTIAKKEIQRHASSLENSLGLKVKFDDDVYSALLFAEGSAADARTVRARAESFFNNELFELLRLISSDRVNTGVDDVQLVRVKMDLSGASTEIKDFFSSPNQAKALVFADPDVVEECRTKAPKFEIVGMQDAQKTVEYLKKNEVDFVLLDMRYGAPAASLSNLNLEDVQSPARDCFKFLREHHRELPIYLLEDRGDELSEEEKVSFYRQGVRGTLAVAMGKDRFAKELEQIAGILYQQANMTKLAKANKLISFSTAQTVSKTGKNATIKLYDFQLTTAVDAEDSKNVLSAVSRPDVHFEDVIGAGDAKQELKYFVEYLKNPKKYMGTGVKAPKGVLLYGPPGTGKTMLAKAMACEAGVTFLAMEGNAFLQASVGAGPEKVHEIFRTARKYAPAILFVDEIDSIAKERRGGAASAFTGEDALNAFLAEMDGFSSNPSKPVFVLAATNFSVEPGTAKSLDPALLRRFDRRVYIDLPDKDDRIRFMRMKIKKNPAIEISEEQMDHIAVRSTGMSLASLDSVFELALRSAIRAGSVKVTDAILDEAFETFNSGEVKQWDAAQLERVARHEAGHAMLCWLGGMTPAYMTIVSRSNYGGYMQPEAQENKGILTKDELLSRIRMSLAGRAAEIVYYGERDGISTGASGDLESATRTAQRIVCVYGMDDDFGLSVVDASAAITGALSAEVKTAVNRILNEQMEQAIALIRQNKSKMDALVETLMVKNHLNGEQIKQILTDN